jgi:hypothetical protein
LQAAEREQRISALDTRLRIEGFVFRCLAVAAPYLNDEDKVGWKAADALKFLQSEIDPHFLTGRQVAISPQVPDAGNPTDGDYEKLDWSTLVSEPDINLRKLNQHWQSMGQLLHQDLQNKGFDVENARSRIDAAINFCDALTTASLFVNSDLQPIERTCSNGHITKRNAARLKAGQIIPCMNHQCRSVFIVECTKPLIWKEFYLEITCDDCSSINSYPLKDLISLSYWKTASVSCLNNDCESQTIVQWVLSKPVSNEGK